MALELRPNCERCDRDLLPASREAYICSFECTFCRECAEKTLKFVCPNCGGELARRPIRPAEKLPESRLDCAGDAEIAVRSERMR